MPAVGPRKQIDTSWHHPVRVLALVIAFFGVVLLIAEVTSLSFSTVAGWGLGILAAVFIVGVIIAAIRGVPYR